MFHAEILEKLRKEASGGRALEYVLRFWPYDRLSTFPGYQRAADETRMIMEELGFSEVETIRYATTGKNFFADWEGPQGWDAIHGTLDVSAPDGETRRIADRASDPCHLMLWCGSTPAGGLKAPIVRADGKGSLKGKLVFHDQVALDSKLRKRLIEEGALGVISDELPYWPDVRNREDNMDLVRWHNSFLFPANEENLLAFSIKPADGDWLRRLLAEHGELESSANVECRLYEDTLPVTTGVIRGSVEPEKEIWLIQHLHEVGAHDNASGVATAIEAVRALKKLVESGVLEPPRRTIRVICSWEIIGFLAHLCANPEITQNVVCAFNPDMVGPDMEKCKSWLQLYVEPHCNPHCIDDLTVDLTRRLFAHHPRWHWEIKEFMINDNFMADPAIDVPTPSLIFMRDRHYHSSSDRPENLSPQVMGEIAALLGAGVYAFTNGGEKSAVEVAELTLEESLRQLASLTARQQNGTAFDERVRYLRPIFESKLESTRDFLVRGDRNGKLEDAVNAAKSKIAKFIEVGRNGKSSYSRKPSDRKEKEAASLVPVRKLWGSYGLARVPEKVRTKRKLNFSTWSYDDNAPIFWADGKRSIFDIQWMVGQELGKTPDIEYLLTLFRTLEEYDYFELKKA
ncbi:MAG: M28 family peptidase [Candidatus Glassbacteria bacterium]|nr:M28 family peptidase [Candidatus Glassbacteria bacterium]